MVIKKDGSEYTVKESPSFWTVKKEIGKVSVEVKISKDICPTIEELQAYILENDIFGGRE